MSNTELYETANKVEANGDHLERLRTVGGHVDDRTQPSLPTTHRRLANPAPLGLLSFATGIYLSFSFSRLSYSPLQVYS